MRGAALELIRVAPVERAANCASFWIGFTVDALAPSRVDVFFLFQAPGGIHALLFRVTPLVLEFRWLVIYYPYRIASF